jgi:hypothetical protein
MRATITYNGLTIDSPETIEVNENSVAVVHIAFDDNGTSIQPTEFKWSLVNSAGEVINNRHEETPSDLSDISIVLEGDDLALSGAVGEYRYIYWEALFSQFSHTISEQIELYIHNLYRPVVQ